MIPKLAMLRAGHLAGGARDNVASGTSQHSKDESNQPRLLIIGHSHTECLAAAVETDAVRVINLLDFPEKDPPPEALVPFVVSRAKGFEPNAVCLIIRGNRHNIIGIFENPEPFSIGDQASGSVPMNPERHFIPYALIADLFETTADKELISQLYTAFPGTHRLYLNPPPPLGDFEHIRRNPGIFRTKIALGPSPDELRLALYKVQTDVMRRIARDNKATFIETDLQTIDDRGFLASSFFKSDPTHANTDYGRIMLNRTLEAARNAA